MVYIRIQKRKLNEDTQRQNKYEETYFIKDCISPTNVTLFDKKGKQLPRSTLINNLKKCHIREQFIQPKTNTPKNTESSSTLSENSTDSARSIDSYHGQADNSSGVEHEVRSSSTEEYDSDVDDMGLSSSECGSDSGSSIKHSSLDDMDDLSSTSNISISDEDDMRFHHYSKKKEIYEPVNTVLIKRITGDGAVQYYKNWNNN